MYSLTKCITNQAMSLLQRVYVHMSLRELFMTGSALQSHSQ